MKSVLVFFALAALLGCAEMDATTGTIRLLEPAVG